MKTDVQIKADVTQELASEPSVNAAHIGVAVEGGVVTLTGHIGTYAEKYAVERAVQRVNGVRAIVVELDVKLAAAHQRDDSDIANAVEHALSWHALVPHEAIKVKIEKAWVTLSGEVHWDYQRSAAARAVQNLLGVRGVSNLITIQAQPVPDNIARRIRQALERQAQREAEHIEIKIQGATVTLCGKVHSLAERYAVQGATWATPGVNMVINELQVVP